MPTQRPAVLRRLHAIDARRLRESRRWVVCFSVLRPFGPRMTWSPRRRPEDHTRVPCAGPCISRKTKEITSPPACGPGQEAVSRLQRFGRMCISKQQRIAKFWNHLSGTAAGVREVLADAAERRIRDRVDRTLGAARNKRTEGRLRLAARYTQRMWRSKLAYAFNDENARTRRPRPFTPSTRVVSIRRGREWFFFRFRGRRHGSYRHRSR